MDFASGLCKDMRTDNGLLPYERFFIYTKMKQLAWVQFFSWFALFSVMVIPHCRLHNIFAKPQTQQQKLTI
jgi:hypothetical protein